MKCGVYQNLLGILKATATTENNKLGYRTQDRITIWTIIICTLKKRVTQKLIVIGLFTFVFLLPFPTLPPQLRDLR